MRKFMLFLTAVAVTLPGLAIVTADSAQALTITQNRNQVISKLNAARATKCGAAITLKWSDGLTDSAQFHTDDMANNSYVAYDTPFPYEAWGHRITRISGFNNLIGEYVDFGPTTPQALVDRMLIPNTTTRKLALNCQLKVVGVGYAFRAPTGTFWTVDFSDKIVNVGP